MLTLIVFETTVIFKSDIWPFLPTIPNNPWFALVDMSLLNLKLVIPLIIVCPVDRVYLPVIVPVKGFSTVPIGV